MGFLVLLTSMTLNDLKPFPPKRRVFGEFFVFSAPAHTSRVSCDKMAKDRTRRLAYKIFSIRRKFSSLSPNPLGSKRPVHASVKER